MLLQRENKTHTPLYVLLAEIAGLWMLVNTGYYFILPSLGFGVSYNSAPLVTAAYFLFCAAGIVRYFWDFFSRWLLIESRIWVDGFISFAFAILVWGLLYLLTLFPVLRGPLLIPYSDILFATPWYFFPKAAEILVQQTLITVLVLALSYRFHSMRNVIIGYIVCFGGAHIIMFALNSAPTEYAASMTIAAVFTAFIFPPLILRVRGGFVYTYMIHLLFYVLLALFLHTWPPPGYML